jgi:hypothetical protein
MPTNEITIAVILDPDFGTGLAKVLAKYPAWVVDTPVNRGAWSANRPIENSAMFRVADSDKRLQNLLEALPDIECHFGPDSYPLRPYNRMRVLGLVLTPEVETQLRLHGFETFALIDGGFEANLRRE